MSQEALCEKIARFLLTHDNLSLATVAPEGQPMSTAVSYVNIDLVVYFMTAANANKVRNLSAEPRVGYTIASEYRDWSTIRAIQAHGITEPMPESEEAARVKNIYSNKFSMTKKLIAELDLRLYKITPTLMRLIDNTVSFGYREVVKF